jgi:hypothetical protein
MKICRIGGCSMRNKDGGCLGCVEYVKYRKLGTSLLDKLLVKVPRRIKRKARRKHENSRN